MISSNNNAVGIIFPNAYDELVPQLTNVRLMASVPFASRYRMIDFPLSAMSNCGIDNILIMVRKNYHSLIDHLGSGREWDLVRKSGGLHVFPPYSTGFFKPSTGRIDALASILDNLRRMKEDYVILTDANIACNFDYDKFIAFHRETGADITVAYNEQELGEGILNSTSNDALYYTLKLDGTRVTNIYVNQRTSGTKNFSMNTYIMGRELLIDIVNTAYVRGMEYLTRDAILPRIKKLNVQAYKFEGYVARISSLKTYFEESMKLLDANNLDALFSGKPVYTKIRDDNPTRYITGAKVSNIMAADGCVIEGEVENCVLFRGVKIGKGAKVKNCILMQDTVVEAGASIEYLITDKDVTITKGKSMNGTATMPIYIAKFSKV